MSGHSSSSRRVSQRRQRRNRPPGATAGPRPLAWRAPDRAELPRDLVAGPSLNATFASRSTPPGNIGFSSQSGALGLALLEAAVTRGLGLSAFVSIGNKADVSSNDLLEWWEDDAATEAILLYLESFGNPRRFGRIARRVARRKPILALKSGRSRAASAPRVAHGSARGLRRRRRRALPPGGRHSRGDARGARRRRRAVLAQPGSKAARSAIVTNAGGLGILCADACEAAGLEVTALGEETVSALRRVLPAEASVANPVDMLGGATAATYRGASACPARRLACSRGHRALRSCRERDGRRDRSGGRRGRPEAGSDKPVLAVDHQCGGYAGGASRGERVAPFAYPESAARALGRVAERADWLRRPQGTVPAGGDRPRAWRGGRRRGARQRGRHVARPAATSRVARGLRPPARCGASGRLGREAVASRGARLPGVVKTAAPGAHKTETGGIALDLADAEAAVDAARIGFPVIVQPMLAGGGELLAGVVQDPVFGPLVAFGPGGVLAELIGEAAFRIAPLTDVDAEELVTAERRGGCSPGFGARLRPTRRRSPTSSCGSPASARTSLQSPSSTSTPCSGFPTVVSSSTPASAFGGPRPSRGARPGEIGRGLAPGVPDPRPSPARLSGNAASPGQPPSAPDPPSS